MSKKPAPVSNEPKGPLFTEEEKQMIENKDKARITQVIQNYMQENQDFVDEIYVLTKQKIQIDQEYEAVMEKLNKDINESQKNQTQYQEYLTKIHEENQQKMSSERIEAAKKLDDLEHEFTFESRQAEYQLKKLEEKKESVLHIQEKEEQTIKEVQNLLLHLNNIEFEFNDKLLSLNSIHTQQNDHLQSIFGNQIWEQQKNAVKETSHCKFLILEVMTERNIQKQKNIQLQEKLSFYETQFKIKKKQKQRTLSEFKQINQNDQLDRIKIQNYRQINTQKLKKHDVLDSQKGFLKDYLKESIMQNSKQLQFEQLKQSQILEDYQKNVIQLKDQLNTLIVQHIKTERLAQEMIGQREEIEYFLKENVFEIQKQIKERSKTQRKQDSSIQSMSQQKLNYEDLDLEEKEKIFRIFLLKINQKHVV